MRADCVVKHFDSWEYLEKIERCYYTSTVYLPFSLFWKRQEKKNPEFFPQYTKFYWHIKAIQYFIYIFDSTVYTKSRAHRRYTCRKICIHFYRNMYTMCKTYGITNKRRGVGDRDRWETRAAIGAISDICWTTCCWERGGLSPNSSRHRSENRHPKNPHGTAQKWSAFTLHYSVVKALKMGKRNKKQESRQDLTCSTWRESSCYCLYLPSCGPKNHRAKSRV